MDYEKKYNEALERARQFSEHPLLEDSGNIVEYIFPELKESDDERIRKALIRFHKSTIDVDGIKGDDIISWLEKQGEHKVWTDNDYDKVKSIEYLLHELDNHNFDDWFNSLITPYKESADSYCQEHCKGFQETGKCFADRDPRTKKEAESVDKAKPKFKIGDFILNDYCIGKVIEVTNDAYLLDSGQGIPFSCEHNAHLWTLEDAKDGDVLYFDDNTIVIFKDLYNATTFHSYCHIEDGVFDISKDDMPDWWEGKGFHPATKEQRDILFAKMKEAGYEWDAEKKEPKLLVTNGGDFEPIKLKEESEDERIRKKFINLVKMSNEVGGFALHKWEADEMLAWLEKQGEQKEYTFKSIPRLLDMIEPTERTKAYTKKLINTLTEEGYITDAKIVEECLKQMNGEDVAMAVMDEKQGEQKPQKALTWKHWENGIAGNGEGEDTFLIKWSPWHYSVSSCLGSECDYIELSELDKLLRKSVGEGGEMKTPEESLGITSEEYSNIVNECLFSNTGHNEGVNIAGKRSPESITTSDNDVQNVEYQYLSLKNNQLSDLSDKVDKIYKIMCEIKKKL